MLRLHAFVFAIFALLGLAVDGRTHQAASGWTYPSECCSNEDCRMMQPGEIEARTKGYYVKSTGDFVPYSSRIIKSSGDSNWHICVTTVFENEYYLGDRKPHVLCIFVPFAV